MEALRLTATDEVRAQVEALLDPSQPGAPEDMRSLRLISADLSGLDLSGLDLSGLDLSRANLSDTVLHHASLAGATLFAARMEGAELMGADLRGANLSEARGREASLGHAQLDGAVLIGAHFEGAGFIGASMRQVDARSSGLDGARMLDVDLEEADLSHALLRGAELTGANLTQACLRGTRLKDARLEGTRGYASADWVGADVHDADFRGAWLLRRAVIDQNFLWEFRRQSRIHEMLYQVWWVTSDCGRSIWRWAAFTLTIGFVYGLGYEALSMDYGPYETWLSPFYFSIVTLTTLGFGDAVPTGPISQLAVMSEVVVGYVMLGGLMSIFSSKMGRRGD